MDLSISSEEYFACNNELLLKLLDEPLLAAKPILVLGNKKDIKRLALQ
jgi:hypothetical protein